MHRAKCEKRRAIDKNMGKSSAEGEKNVQSNIPIFREMRIGCLANGQKRETTTVMRNATAAEFNSHIHSI